jgi:transporter family protein
MPKWIAACLVAVLLWGIWGLVFAVASGLTGPLNVAVLNTIGLLPVAVGLLFSKGVWDARHMRRGIGWGVTTGLCGNVANIALAAAFALGAEASIAAPLTALFPLVTLVLAVLFLRERLNPIQVAGMGIALIAIYLFSSAGGSLEVSGVWASLTAPWMLFALLALTLFGIAGITQKLSTNDISNELSTICYVAAAALVTLGILATQRLDWSLPAGAWVAGPAAGVLIGLALWIGFAAYRGGKASIVTAVIALYPVVTVALAVPFLDETMTLVKAIAILLAILAGLALTYEKSAAQDLLAPAPAQPVQPSPLNDEANGERR